MASALPWKVSTFTALALAGFFGVRTPRASATTPLAGEPSRPSAAVAPSRGFWSGWMAPAALPESPTSVALARLHGATNPDDACETLRDLGQIGDDAAVSAVADVAEQRRGTVRMCAVEALGKAPGAPARSWLQELLADRDPAVRGAAVTALAVHASDPETRAVLFAAASADAVDVRLAALEALGKAHVAEAAPLIVEALKSADPQTEGSLIVALGESHSPLALAVLTARVRDGSPTERQTALAALGALGAAGGEGAVGVLGEMLARGGGDDVRSAVQALAQMGDGAAHAALMDAASSTRPDVARAALRALGDNDGDDVRELMAKELSSSDPQTAGSAAQYFGSHHDEASVPTLQAMAMQGGRLGPEAVSALVQVGGDEARTALAAIALQPGAGQGAALSQLATMPGGADQAQKLALQLLHQGGGVSGSAIEVLTNDKSAEGRESLSRIVREGGGLATSALYALARRGDPESVRAVVDVARSATSRERRTEALTALGGTNEPHVASTLLAALHESDPQIRRAALQGLATLGGPDAERAIGEVATSHDTRLRAYAVQTLGRMDSADATRELESLTTDKDTGVARSALAALSRSAPDKAARIAMASMTSGDEASKVTAVQISGQFDQESMRGILLAGVKDPSEEVAGAAARALGQLGGPEAERALGDMLTSSSSSANVRRTAAETLDEMGGDASKRYADWIAKYKSSSEGSEESESGSSDSVDVE